MMKVTSIHIPPDFAVMRITAMSLCIFLHNTIVSQDFININTEVTIQPAMNINTKHLEFAPMYYGSGIVFVQSKGRDDLIDIRIGMPFYELMYAELGPDGLPGKASNFSPNIRTRFHEGPASFTNDLQQIYFTRQNMLNGQNVQSRDRQTNLKIYIADKGTEDWLNQRELPFCSDEYSIQCPALSPDNQQVIFMSDMPGGYGGWDLYISDKYSGTWSDPVNLGPVINTPKYERLPYWHSTGVLFFASDGHGGAGGLDLFASLRNEDGTFSPPVNLGPNFNSRQDDLSLICDAEGKTGFFASSRKQGFGKDDIYYFISDQSIFSQVLLEKPALVNMTLTVREAISLNPIPDVGMWIFPIGSVGPEELDNFFDKERITTTDGDEVLKLNPKNDGNIRPHHISDIKGSVPASLKANTDYLVVLRASNYLQREVTLERSSIVQGHEYFLNLEPPEKTIAEIPVRDKDCIGTGALVLGAVRERPLSAVLVQIRSTCTGTVQVMETDDSGRFRTCLVPGCEYKVRFLKTGYLENTYTYLPGMDPADRTVYLTEADLEERTEGPPVAGDVLILEHIYYDFNKSAIRTGDARELESLAEFMQRYPEMTVELESHTDSRGTAEYNMELATRRGESVQDFLANRGVSRDRVQLKPMGESRLRNACADGVPCTEEQHQKNRRTEIRIVSVDPKIEVKYPDQH